MKERTSSTSRPRSHTVKFLPRASFVDWSVYAVRPFCSFFRALRYYRYFHGVIQLGALKKVELLAPNRRGRKADRPEFLHRVPDHSRRAANHGCPAKPIAGLGSHGTDKPPAAGVGGILRHHRRVAKPRLAGQPGEVLIVVKVPSRS